MVQETLFSKLSLIAFLTIFTLFGVDFNNLQKKSEKVETEDECNYEEVEALLDSIMFMQTETTSGKAIRLKGVVSNLKKENKYLKTEIKGLKNDLNTLNDSLVKIKEKTPRFEEKGILFWKHKDTIE
jgi:peptidoglycan hydrolase CwlO-like protein